MERSLSFTLVAVLAVSAISACSKPAPTWARLDLPATTGLVLRDVADCAGRWYAAGAAGTHPAAWTSTDGKSWASVPFRPLPSSFYGPHEVIASIACSAGMVEMIGAVPGGAHGNPRISTWRLAGDGAMVENAAPFETYGGDEAVNVGPVAAGPRGFAIAGNRTSGAAGWFSGDGRTFALAEVAGHRAPAQTAARDIVALPDGRWALVGGVATGLDSQPAAWLTGDGKTWTPDTTMPPLSGFNEVQRAVQDGDDLVAAGVRGSQFGLWHWHAGTWTTAGPAFGGDPGGVRSLTLVAGKPVVAGGGLWVSGRSSPAPGVPLAVAGRGDTLLMATSGALWQETINS